MKVKDLVKQLQELPQDSEIEAHCYMEQGRGGSWDEDCDWDIEQHEEDPNKVVISVSGDESSESGGYD